MNWLTMFKPPKHGHIRFAHSPSSGGYNQKLQTANAAWDFQNIIADYDVIVDYTFSARTALRKNVRGRGFSKSLILGALTHRCPEFNILFQL
ncbi:MAG: hypothetical protein L3J39_00150 [Verrucomicrobiales bacterium]|nr:hypothetical protein [Verrucomicrobiales bacterium]